MDKSKPDLRSVLVSVPWDGLSLQHISMATSLETYFTREPFMLGEPRKPKWPLFVKVFANRKAP